MNEDPDSIIADIASKLPEVQRIKFLEAINTIRSNESRGRVRLRPMKKPTADQRLILDTFAANGSSLVATAEALADYGIGYQRICYVTRRFAVRNVTERAGNKYLRNPSEVVKAYLRDAHEAGLTATFVKKELSEHLGRPISEANFRVLCESVGVQFIRKEFPLDKRDELVQELLALEKKYHVSVQTLSRHFYEAIKGTEYERGR